MGKEMYGQSCFDSREENVSKRLSWKRIQMVQKSRFTSSVNVKSMEDMFRFLETKRIHVFSSVTVRMLRRR